MSSQMPTYHRGKTYRSMGTSHTTTTTAIASKTTAESDGLPGYEWMKPGAKVELRADSNYGAAVSNPKKNSGFACKGTVTKVESRSGADSEARPIKVAWDNGTQNDYFFTDLDRYDPSLWGAFEDPLVEKEEKKGPMFNTGDTVFLKPGFKTVKHEHPALGTFFQCPGTVQIAKHDNIGVRLTIKWRNSLIATYDIQYDTEKNPSKCALINSEDSEGLKRFVEENPNFAYKLQKSGVRGDSSVLDFFRAVMGIEEEISLDIAEHGQYKAEYKAEYFTLSDELDDTPEEVDPETHYATFDLEATLSHPTSAKAPSQGTLDNNTEEEE